VTRSEPRIGSTVTVDCNAPEPEEARESTKLVRFSRRYCAPTANPIGAPHSVPASPVITRSYTDCVVVAWSIAVRHRDRNNSSLLAATLLPSLGETSVGLASAVPNGFH